MNRPTLLWLLRALFASTALGAGRTVGGPLSLTIAG